MPKQIDLALAYTRLSYVRATGDLIFNFRQVRTFRDRAFNERFAGTSAMRLHSDTDGRVEKRVYLEKTLFVAPRVIWAMCTGEDPGDSMIIPIDHDPLNTRLENLRLADHCAVAQGRPQQKNNRSGYTGVFRGRKGGFNFHVGDKGERHWRYGYATARDAAVARDELARKLHGEFFRSSVEEHDRISAGIFQ